MLRKIFNVPISTASRILWIAPTSQQNYKREISTRQDITDLLSKAALGYDPKSPPDYIGLYNEGCQLAESNHLVFARGKFFEALKDAAKHKEKGQIDLIVAEIEQIDKQIALNPHKYPSENKIKSILPWFFFLIGGYFLRDVVPFKISPSKKSI